MTDTPDFKPGDRVEYTNPGIPKLFGKVGTVISAENLRALVFIKTEEVPSWGAFRSNLRLVGADPDVITINRADLPEVREVGRDLMSGDGRYGFFLDAAGHRKGALQQLAVAEFLEAREKAAEEVAAAEKEAKDKLDKRRDELAAELAPRWDQSSGANWYANVSKNFQGAIDRIIELEDAAK